MNINAGEQNKTIDQLREEIITLAQWAYVGAATEKEDKQVELLLDKIIGLIAKLDLEGQ